jgi:hypothetical protein
MNKELLNKAKVNYFINELPLDLQSVIFSFVSPTDTAKIIKKVIDVYKKDHASRLTKQFNLYYAKDILSFVNYIYDSNSMPDDYDFGPLDYNNDKFIYFVHGWMDWLVDKPNRIKNM